MVYEHLLWLLLPYACYISVACFQIPNDIRKSRKDPGHKDVLAEFWKVRVWDMCVCMYVCVYVCVLVHVCQYMCVGMCACACVCVCSELCAGVTFS